MHRPYILRDIRTSESGWMNIFFIIQNVYSYNFRQRIHFIKHLSVKYVHFIATVKANL